MCFGIAAVRLSLVEIPAVEYICLLRSETDFYLSRHEKE
jgi:hypothetical protein